MDIEQLIYTRATTYAGLTALIGTRFYPEQLPQSPTLPAVTYRKISDPMITRVMDGVLNVRYPRFQMDVWASSASSAAAVAVQLRGAFQAWSDTDTIVEVSFAIIDGEWSGHEPDTDEFRRSLDVRIWYKQGAA